MKNRKGLSDVVSTVLIILIIVAAIGIIGTIVLKNVGQTGTKLSGASSCQEMDIKATKCLSNSSSSTATINRGAAGSKTAVVKLDLIYKNAAGTTTILNLTGNKIPAALASVINWSETIGGPGASPLGVQAKLNVAATIVTDDGTNYQCDPSPNEIDCTPS